MPNPYPALAPIIDSLPPGWSTQLDDAGGGKLQITFRNRYGERLDLEKVNASDLHDRQQAAELRRRVHALFARPASA